MPATLKSKEHHWTPSDWQQKGCKPEPIRGWGTVGRERWVRERWGEELKERWGEETKDKRKKKEKDSAKNRKREKTRKSKKVEEEKKRGQERDNELKLI